MSNSYSIFKQVRLCLRLRQAYLGKDVMSEQQLLRVESITTGHAQSQALFGFQASALVSATAPSLLGERCNE